MASTDQERWRRVKDQLRSELGDDVFTSWFGRMELDAVDKGVVRLSVPTRFLRNWIQSHYSEKVLTRWQTEESDVTRLELSVRSAMIRPMVAKPKMPEVTPPLHNGRDSFANGSEIRASVPFMTVHEALGVAHERRWVRPRAHRSSKVLQKTTSVRPSSRASRWGS